MGVITSVLHALPIVLKRKPRQSSSDFLFDLTNCNDFFISDAGARFDMGWGTNSICTSICVHFTTILRVCSVVP